MTQDFEKRGFHKRSVSLHGHKTSISLEQAFWDVLEDTAFAQNLSLIQLIQKVDEHRHGSLSSALRLYALKYALRKKA